MLILLVLAGIMGLATLWNPLEYGLMSSWYDNSAWKGEPVTTLPRPSIDLSTREHILPDLRKNFSVTWKGAIFVPQSGDYEFATRSDDGSDLYVGGEHVVANGGFHGVRTQTGTLRLTKGFYEFTVRYMQGAGLSTFQCYWTPPGQAERVAIPARHLFLKPYTLRTYLRGRGCEIVIVICTMLAILSILGWIAGRYADGIVRLPRCKQSTIVILVILGVFGTHFFWSKISISIDSIWSTYVALSIVREGNVNLDEYERVLSLAPHYRDRQGQHYYNLYPLGTPLMATPMIWFVDRFVQRAFFIDLVAYYNQHAFVPHGLEACIASWIVAVAAALMYGVSCLFFQRRFAPLLLTFIFAFCTSLWSTASRGLWQHGPSALMLAAAVYLVWLAEIHPRHRYWALRLMAVCLSFSFWIRPTNALSIVILTGYVFWRHREQAVGYTLYGMLAAMPIFIFNLKVYGHLTPTYYRTGGQLNIGSPVFWEGLVGTLVSPSRGLFIYSPVLLFALYGIYVKIRQHQMTLLDLCLAVIPVLHWIVTSGHQVWWGGHSYGPRYFTEINVYLVYFLIPVFAQIPSMRGVKKAVLTSLLVCSIGFSFFVHYQGAMSREVNAWSAYPVDVNQEPSRLWDWTDIQFLRGIRNREP